MIADTDLLPAGFQMIPRLLKLLESAEVDTSELAEVIRLDPGLTADVLRICNSAFFAGARKVTTVSEGILRIGVLEVYRVVMAVIASRMYDGQAQSSPPHQVDLWNHSLCVAVAAQLLGERAGVAEPEVGFTVGLLHDLGKQLISLAFPDEYDRLLEQARDQHAAVWGLEVKRFSTNHAEVGAQLLQRWNFPQKIVVPVHYHHEPHRANEYSPLAACVYAADLLVYRMNSRWAAQTSPASRNDQFLALAGLTPAQLGDLQAEVATHCAQLQTAFA